MLLHPSISKLPESIQIALLRFQAKYAALDVEAKHYKIFRKSSRSLSPHHLASMALVDAYLDIVEPVIRRSMVLSPAMATLPAPFAWADESAKAPYLDDLVSICCHEGLSQPQLNRILLLLLTLLDHIPKIERSKTDGKLTNCDITTTTHSYFSYANAFRALASNSRVSYLYVFQIIDKALDFISAENEAVFNSVESAEEREKFLSQRNPFSDETIDSSLCRLVDSMSHALKSTSNFAGEKDAEFATLIDKKFSKIDEVGISFALLVELKSNLERRNEYSVSPSYNDGQDTDNQDMTDENDFVVMDAVKLLPNTHELQQLMKYRNGSLSPSQDEFTTLIMFCLKLAAELDDKTNDDSNNLAQLVALQHDIENMLVRMSSQAGLSESQINSISNKILLTSNLTFNQLPTLVGKFFEVHRPTEQLIIEHLSNRVISMNLPLLLSLMKPGSPSFAFEFIEKSNELMDEFNRVMYLDPQGAPDIACMADCLSSATSDVIQRSLIANCYPQLLSGNQLPDSDLAILLTTGLEYDLLDVVDIELLGINGLHGVCQAGGKRLEDLLSKNPKFNDMVTSVILRKKLSELSNEGSDIKKKSIRTL